VPSFTLTKQKTGPVVGLDIETGSIAATEVALNGSARVTASAIDSLESGAFHEGEVLDPERLAAALKSVFANHKLSKRVRLGIGNQRLVVRPMRLPAIDDPKEMEAAVRFRAQEQVPMPLDQAVLEYQVVGGVPAEEGGAPQVDVVVVAARREMVASFIEPIRRAGLDLVGVDLAAFGMIRALASAGARPNGEGQEPQPVAAVLYCNLGDVTNLAVARGRTCLFTRISLVGLETMAAPLISAHGLTPEHVRQWLSFVGLETPVEDLAGDPEIVKASRYALEDGISSLVDELRLSLDYYGAQEGAVAVERIVLSGPGSAIAGVPAQMEARLGLPISAVRPAGLSGFDEPAAARLTVPFGLALEE
jgi:type IV pilus assembly protein PilM